MKKNKVKSIKEEIKKIIETNEKNKIEESYFYYNPNSFNIYGKTVNSIVDDPQIKSYLPAMRVEDLSLEESLYIAIKRTINKNSIYKNEESKEIDFYDEVNWHLQKLGQNPVKPAIIKAFLSKFIK